MNDIVIFYEIIICAQAAVISFPNIRR